MERMLYMYKVNALPRILFLGKQGEHLAREIQFDVSPWLEKWPDGQCAVTAMRPGGTTPYIANAVMTEGV